MIFQLLFVNIILPVPSKSPSEDGSGCKKNEPTRTAEKEWFSQPPASVFALGATPDRTRVRGGEEGRRECRVSVYSVVKMLPP